MSDLKLTTDGARVSYGVGRQMGEQLRENPIPDMQLAAVLTGLQEAFQGVPSTIDDETMRASFEAINKILQAEANAEAEKAVAAGRAFLAENASKPGVVTLDSGLQYEVLTAGSGQQPTADSKVKTHYHGTLVSGKTFDSSYERGTPAEFPVRGVIAGWTEALQLMQEGSKWRLYVPSELAYGSQSVGSIPANSTLIFDVELLEVLD